MLPIDTMAKAVYAGVFSGADMPTGVQVTAFKGGALKGAIGNGLTFVEQNPQTNSAYAKLAQQGHNILWVLRGGKYIGKVMDGNPDPHLTGAQI